MKMMTMMTIMVVTNVASMNCLKTDLLPVKNSMKYLRQRPACYTALTRPVSSQISISPVQGLCWPGSLQAGLCLGTQLPLQGLTFRSGDQQRERNARPRMRCSTDEYIQQGCKTLTTIMAYLHTGWNLRLKLKLEMQLA